MCGRYGIYGFDPDTDTVIKENKGYHFKPNYNVAPSHVLPIITLSKNNTKQLREMKWGIHRIVGPSQEKDIINTRSDKAFGRFWGKTVRTARCLVPANGFYEWRQSDKVPFWIKPYDYEQFNFAGIFSEDDKGNGSFSIMTTEPNAEMKKIHNRMPVILDKDDELHWLEAEEDGAISNLLLPYHDGGLQIIETSKAVNNVKNNFPELVPT